MAKKTRSSGTKIVVDLGGVKLPPSVAKQLEADIQSSVLQAIASLKLKTGLLIPPPRRLPPGTIGIIYRPITIPRSLLG